MSQNFHAVRDRQSECLVLLSGGNTVGTGFFVAPGVILTCAHVAGARTGATLTATWRGGDFVTRVGAPPTRPPVDGRGPTRTWRC